MRAAVLPARLLAFNGQCRRPCFADQLSNSVEHALEVDRLVQEALTDVLLRVGLHKDPHRRFPGTRLATRIDRPATVRAHSFQCIRVKGVTVETAMVTRSVLLFAAAGLCEIGGGYLVWLWLRDHRTAWLGALGGLVLFLYGVLPTLQPETASFGRVYAAYGGVFVVMSLAWGWWIDGVRPDRYDVIGGAIALAGVAIIMYAPRA